MDFVIQDNMLRYDLLLAVKEAVRSLPHRFVGLIPFSREITSDTPIIGLDHIPYGSTSFVEEAYRRRWRGLSFDVERFSYKTACANRPDMLNMDHVLSAEAMIKYLRTISMEEHVFIRPAHDLKRFSGSVYRIHDAIKLLSDAMTSDSSYSYKIDKDTLIVAGAPKNILAEWRWFVVGGVVIDGSMYRQDGQMTKQHVTDVDLHNAAQTLACKWTPDLCCVMDTALLDSGETKVVEFNCINGSGFYNHDIRKIMMAWMRYHNAKASTPFAP